MGHKASSLILTGSLIAISILSINFLLILPTAAQVSPPAYTDVTEFTSSLESALIGTTYTTAFRGTVTTSADIPQTPDSYIDSTIGFGYSWTLSANSMHAVIAIINDSGVDPTSSEWHTHVATLESTSACEGVGSGLEVVGLTSPADAQVTITNNSLELWTTGPGIGFNPYDSAMSFQLLEPTPGVLCLGPP